MRLNNSGYHGCLEKICCAWTGTGGFGSWQSPEAGVYPTKSLLKDGGEAKIFRV